MNANEHLDFYNPDSIYYGNSRHYIQQLENKVRQQQAEIEAGKIMIKGYGKAIDEQQAEIEALKNGLSSAYWHDTFVEVKKPNSDLIYRFKLDDVCKHGVDDGACKECYMEAQLL